MNEQKDFVVVERIEWRDPFTGNHVSVVARTVKAASAEEAAEPSLSRGHLVSVRVIAVDDVPVVNLGALTAWRDAKWAREREAEDEAELAHALEVVAKHREKMGEAKP